MLEKIVNTVVKKNNNIFFGSNTDHKKYEIEVKLVVMIV